MFGASPPTLALPHKGGGDLAGALLLLPHEGGGDRSGALLLPSPSWGGAGGGGRGLRYWQAEQ